MRVLLLGGSGQLGAEIRRRWIAEITAPAHQAFDLADPSSFEALVRSVQPDVVVNCAAFHKVDECETRVADAFGINAVAVDALAAVCSAHDLPLVTISTDYVFNGNLRRPYVESDGPDPLSAYGISKYAGELLVQRRDMKSCIVRTCGVYGLHASRTKGYTFIDRIISEASAGKPVRVVSDVVCSPTYAGHLAEALERLVRSEAYGLYHVANVGPVSWYDFAVEALRQAGIDHPVEPISASEWKAMARRPAYSPLASEKLAGLGIAMPSWAEGIAAYLADKRAADTFA